MDDPADPEDVRRIGRDPLALEAFYTAHYDAVVRYLARRLDDPHDVADLVADTFLTALDGAAGFDPARGRPLAWLLGIAHNTLRHWYRSRRADRQAVTRLSGRRLLDSEDILRLEERIDAERQATRARGAYDSLAPTDRELLDLVELTGLTPREAAQAMGLPQALVRVRLFRARTRLRTAFDVATALDAKEKIR